MTQEEKMVRLSQHWDRVSKRCERAGDVDGWEIADKARGAAYQLAICYAAMRAHLQELEQELDSKRSAK